jgi:hypothetical protein
MTSGCNTPAPLGNNGLWYSIIDLATLNDLSVTDLSHIHTTSIHELHQALGQLVALTQHLLWNSWLLATIIVVDCNHLRLHHDQAWSTWQIAQNLVIQCETEIQQLQSRNQDITAESNAYQDRITTVQNEFNHECANAKVQQTAAAGRIAAGQQQLVQLASISDSERFDGSWHKLWSFVAYLYMKLTANASYFPNL